MGFFINYGGTGGASDGRVKIDENDGLSFLGSKIDDKTIKVIANKLVAKELDGQTVSVDDINKLSGITDNVQSQINNLVSTTNFVGVADKHSDIALGYPNPINRDMVIVIEDETHGGNTTVYIYDGVDWVFGGNFDINMRDFNTNPIDLSSGEVTGILPNDKLEELGKVGSKLVDETALADGKSLVYNAITEKYELKDVSGSVDWKDF